MGDEAQAAAVSAQPQLARESVQPTARLQATTSALSGMQLKTMATRGGFAVDDATGDRMIQALEGVIDSLTARWHALEKLQESPPLSSTATARWVSGHMVNTATDANGLLTQLQAARDEFPAYVEAIKLAKRNYQAQDDNVRATMTKVKRLS
jgi:hypothetical protein